MNKQPWHTPHISTPLTNRDYSVIKLKKNGYTFLMFDGTEQLFVKSGYRTKRVTKTGAVYTCG